MVGTEDFAVMSATADRRGARHHMRNTSLALAAAATLAISAASPAYAGPRYDYGPWGQSVPAHLSRTTRLSLLVGLC